MFGLTLLGPERPFAALKPTAYGLSLFSTDEWQDAFAAVVGARTALSVEEVDLVLRRVFHGPAPHVAAGFLAPHVAAAAEAEGGVTLGGFTSALAAALGDEEAARAAAEAVSSIADSSGSSGYTSYEVLRQQKKKEVRAEKGPEQTLRVPATGLQSVGWNAHDAKAETRHPKVYCKETKFAESLIRSGVYFI